MFDFPYFKQWAARPFNPDMGIWGWVFFLGFVLAAVILWRSVITLIIKEV